MTRDEVDEMINACDTDGNGTLLFEEWKAMVPNYVQRRPSERRPSYAIFSFTKAPAQLGKVKEVAIPEDAYSDLQKEPVLAIAAFADVEWN
jgi:hypothetical protein